MDGIEVTVDQSTCIGCGACSKVCFVNTIKVEEGKARVTDLPWLRTMRRGMSQQRSQNNHPHSG
jgi:ferredoxin